MAVYKKIYNCLFIAFLCGGSGIFFGAQGASLASEVQKTKQKTKIEIVKSKLASGASNVANLAQRGAKGARSIGRDVKGFMFGLEGGFAENIKRRLASLAVFVAGGLALRKWLSSAPAQEGQPDPVQERQPENGGQVNQDQERQLGLEGQQEQNQVQEQGRLPEEDGDDKEDNDKEEEDLKRIGEEVEPAIEELIEKMRQKLLAQIDGAADYVVELRRLEGDASRDLTSLLMSNADSLTLYQKSLERRVLTLMIAERSGERENKLLGLMRKARSSAKRLLELQKKAPDGGQVNQGPERQPGLNRQRLEDGDDKEAVEPEVEALIEKTMQGLLAQIDDKADFFDELERLKRANNSLTVRSNPRASSDLQFYERFLEDKVLNLMIAQCRSKDEGELLGLMRRARGTAKQVLVELQKAPRDGERGDEGGGVREYREALRPSRVGPARLSPVPAELGAPTVRDNELLLSDMKDKPLSRRQLARKDYAWGVLKQQRKGKGFGATFVGSR